MPEKECEFAENGRYIMQFDSVRVEVDESLISDGNANLVIDKAMIKFPIKAQLIRKEKDYYILEPSETYTTYLFQQESGIGGKCFLHILNAEREIHFTYSHCNLAGVTKSIVASVEGNIPLRVEWHRTGVLQDGEPSFGASIVYPSGTIEEIAYNDIDEEDWEIIREA